MGSMGNGRQSESYITLRVMLTQYKDWGRDILLRFCTNFKLYDYRTTAEIRLQKFGKENTITEYDYRTKQTCLPFLIDTFWAEKGQWDLRSHPFASEALNMLWKIFVSSHICFKKSRQLQVLKTALMMHSTRLHGVFATWKLYDKCHWHLDLATPGSSSKG